MIVSAQIDTAPGTAPGTPHSALGTPTTRVARIVPNRRSKLPIGPKYPGKPPKSQYDALIFRPPQRAGLCARAPNGKENPWRRQSSTWRKG